MIIRDLPQDEWGRLTPDMKIYKYLPMLDPDFTVIRVVETDDGEIIGSYGKFSICHLEAIEIAPAHQGKAGVLRMILDDVRREVAVQGGMMTAADTPEVERIIRALGATERPVKSFFWPRHIAESAIISVTEA